MRIEVTWLTPLVQECVQIEVPEGTTVREAVLRSGIMERHAGVRLDAGWVGVFARLVPLDTRLQEGDRVELYRPLEVDAKTARRQRARAATRRRDEGSS